MSLITAKIDDEIVHTIEDANPDGSNCVAELIIQCDNHGLTVECPGGEIITIDYSRGNLNVYKFKDREESNPENLTSFPAHRSAIVD